MLIGFLAARPLFAKIALGALAGALVITGTGFAIWRIYDAGYEAGAGGVRAEWQAEEARRTAGQLAALEEIHQRHAQALARNAQTRREMAEALAAAAAEDADLATALQEEAVEDESPVLARPWPDRSRLRVLCAWAPRSGDCPGDRARDAPAAGGP